MDAYDVIVIGAGPGGLAAAKSAKENGASSVLVLEREKCVGGILNQCIHDGFGLHRYHEQLSGPEYAERAAGEAYSAGVIIKTDHLVTEVTADKIVKAVSKTGIYRAKAKSIVFATGCRERTRGAIAIPGSRPAGIYTAGVAQCLLNQKGILIGKTCVILGSGDIGLIMARRLTLEGVRVLAVVEMMSDSGGLSRNIQQCLYDYGIPIYLNHTVSKIIGKKRVEAVEISEVNEDGSKKQGTSFVLECDCLVLSVGLIPENEVATIAGVRVDAKTNGAITDECLQTNIPGVFMCGNSRRVMELADFVSGQGELAGKNAVCYYKNLPMEKWDESIGNKVQKGVPAPNSLTCAVCPKGCQLEIQQGGEVTGNSCAKGVDFARRELVEPERILTTTIRISGNAQQEYLPVRSNGLIKLSEMQDLIDKIHSYRCQAPIKMGQTIIKDIGENHVDIVAQQTIDIG